MNKLLYVVITFLVFTISCDTDKKEKNNNIQKKVEVFPNEKIKILLDSFVLCGEGKNLIHEIYIDKISHWEYDIILYSGKESLTEKGAPIMTTNISGTNFDVYSGVEHYFQSSKNFHDSTIIDTPPLKGVPDGNYWVITDKDGELNIIKDAWAFPFSSSQRVVFEPPQINDLSE